MNGRLTAEEWNDLMNGFADPDSEHDHLDDSQSRQRKAEKLRLILDIPVKGEVVIGRTQRTLKELIQVKSGMIIETENLVNHYVELQINKQLIALGEVVVVGENYGIRIKQVIPPGQIVQKLL
jgi:flagellar motor switch protein FliN